MDREDRELAELRGRIERWRTTRSKQGRMPEPLWSAAAALGAKLGVSCVATELGLGYAALKSRGGAVTAAPSGALGRTEGFVEVAGAQLLGPTAGGPSIELVERDGTRVTITLPAGTQLDIAAMVAALRRRS